MKKIFAISTLCNSGFRIEVCQGVYARKKSWIERSEDIVGESARDSQRSWLVVCGVESFSVVWLRRRGILNTMQIHIYIHRVGGERGGPIFSNQCLILKEKIRISEYIFIYKVRVKSLNVSIMKNLAIQVLNFSSFRFVALLFGFF